MSVFCMCFYFFFFKQKTAYEMRISDWSSDVCSSDLRRIYAHAFNPAKAVIVLSQSAVARTGMIHPSLPARTTFLHNPYVSDAMIARNPIRAAPATPLILSVGRLSRQKDYTTLLRAAAMPVHRPWRLRICGIGPDRKALLALAERLGIADRVEFSGFVADMAPHYSEATEIGRAHV